MKSGEVSYKVTGHDDFRFLCWPQDIYAIFTNLIDNSLYWMNEKKSPDPKITVNIVNEGDSLLHIFPRTYPADPYILIRDHLF